MKKKKIYISGPITGFPNNNREAFEKAKKYLELKGYEAINPFDIPVIRMTDNLYNDYMRCDIAELVTCDEIYMLLQWEKSKGANIEIYIAKSLDFQIQYE